MGLLSPDPIPSLISDIFATDFGSYPKHVSRYVRSYRTTENKTLDAVTTLLSHLIRLDVIFYAFSVHKKIQRSRAFTSGQALSLRSFYRFFLLQTKPGQRHSSASPRGYCKQRL